MSYVKLQKNEERTKPIHDLGHYWERAHVIQPGSEVARKVEEFCHHKRFELQDLLQLDTKYVMWGGGPDLWLAWPGYGRIAGVRTITAIKYRDLATGKRQAAPGSSYGEALVIGDPTSMDWFVAEGETDGARLYNLIGRFAAIMVLPAGALALRESWLARVPRGATVYAALDADKAGDDGSRRLLRMVGSGGVRVRPPGDYKDWCDWPGDAMSFIDVVKEAKRNVSSRVKSFAQLLQQYKDERPTDRQPVRLGFGSIDHDTRGVSDGQVCGLAARTAVGKTWALNSITHNLAAAKVGGVVLSLEMPGVEWAERQMAIYADVQPEEVEKWAKGQRQLPVKEFCNHMSSFVLCDNSLQLNEISGVIAEARSKLGKQMRAVLIDYLGLIDARGDAYERISAVGKGLKELAKYERVAVVVAMQLSRAAGNGSEEVRLEMLRDSGVLEESVDFLLGCWRPEYANAYKPAEPNLKGTMRVKILKNRKGPAGRVVDLRFKELSQRLYELRVA